MNNCLIIIISVYSTVLHAERSMSCGFMFSRTAVIIACGSRCASSIQVPIYIISTSGSSGRASTMQVLQFPRCRCEEVAARAVIQNECRARTSLPHHSGVDRKPDIREQRKGCAQQSTSVYYIIPFCILWCIIEYDRIILCVLYNRHRTYTAFVPYTSYNILL